MPLVRRIPHRWRIAWGVAPEAVTEATQWDEPPVDSYQLRYGGRMQPQDAYPRPLLAKGRIVLISRDGAYAPTALRRPATAPTADRLQQRSAVRWEWYDAAAATWRLRWAGALTNLTEAEAERVECDLQSARLETLSERVPIAAGDTTADALLAQLGGVRAAATARATLLTLPAQNQARLALLTTLAQVMGAWASETRAGQLCFTVPNDLPAATLDAAPLLQLRSALVGDFAIEECETMRAGRVRYEFGEPSGDVDFDTIMLAADLDLAPNAAQRIVVPAPFPNQNYRWKTKYAAGDYTGLSGVIGNTIDPEDTTPVPGYGPPPAKVSVETNPALRSVDAFLDLIPLAAPPAAAKTVKFTDGTIDVTVAAPTAAIAAADIAVDVAPAPDSRSAIVTVSNTPTEAGRQWLHWSGAWRDVLLTRGSFVNIAGFATRNQAAEARRTLTPSLVSYATIKQVLNQRVPGTIAADETLVKVISTVEPRSNIAPDFPTAYGIVLGYEVTYLRRTQPWVVARTAPPTYRYRFGLRVLAHRQPVAGQSGHYIYATNVSATLGLPTAHAPAWWRTHDTAAALHLANTLAIARRLFTFSVLDWLQTYQDDHHALGPCDVIRVSYRDPVRNVEVEEPFVILAAAHAGGVGDAPRTTFTCLSLSTPPTPGIDRLLIWWSPQAAPPSQVPPDAEAVTVAEPARVTPPDASGDQYLFVAFPTAAAIKRLAVSYGDALDQKGAYLTEAARLPFGPIAYTIHRTVRPLRSANLHDVTLTIARA